jgi:hypothetical protein
MKALIFSGALAATLVSSSAAAADDLHLVCVGGGAHLQENSVFAMAHNNYGGAAWGQSVGISHDGYEDAVSIDIVNDEGKIRLPRVLLPPIHGGDSAWFKLTDLKLSNREITGSANVNIVTHPKIRLDRYSGTISINGRMGTFTAQCQKVDVNSRQQF